MLSIKILHTFSTSLMYSFNIIYNFSSIAYLPAIFLRKTIMSIFAFSLLDKQTVFHHFL